MKALFTLPLYVLATTTFAWVCPNNFNSIVEGDSIDQIIAQCGKPASSTTSQQPPNVPQQWQYYIPTQQSNGRITQQSPVENVKMTIAFVNDKVVDISTAQGGTVSSTSLCGARIAIGDSSDTVKTNCGTAAFVQKQDTDAKDVEIVEYKYDTAPPNTLIFENGKLKQRK